MKILLSGRATPQIEEMYAVVIKVDGVEGVVRRETPFGTQPLTTDDRVLALKLLEMARDELHFPDAYLVRFARMTS